MAMFGARYFAAALLAATATTAAAHHSFAAFDNEKTVSLSGTVVRWDWTNPHSFLTLAVPDQGGKAVHNWDLESASPSLLTRVGFTRTTLKPGDKVVVRLHPHRENEFFGSLTAVDLPSGKTMSVNVREGLR